MAAVGLVAAMGFTSMAQAAVTATFSAGATCGGATSALFSPGGAPVQVSLCMTTTSPSTTCGHTIVLQAAAGEDGKFVVTSSSLTGTNYTDPNSEVSQLPLAINGAPNILVVDFGGTSSGPVPTAANQLLTTFSLAPQATATAGSYVISLSSVSTAAVDADGTCGATTVPTESPLTASFTLNRNPAPAFTSASATTFSTASSNSFTVAATGSPAPTLSLTSGTPPSGLTFTPSAGQLVITGTPTSTGTFPLVFTASNGTSATQNFTLTVGGLASQTISFTGPTTQTFSSTLVPLTATASSSLPVTLSSATPFVCAVSGSSAVMLTLGTCTIAANQAGNGTFSQALQVTQSFGINGAVPGAPTIGTPIVGNGQASIVFTAPAANGGSPILSYTATCSGISASGNSSPIGVSGLTNGTSYTCSVTATNAFGTGPSSAQVMVTPSNVAALSVVAVHSRRTHGTAGIFDLPITTGILIGGSVTVEPRLVGAGHQIVFEFNSPVTSLTGVSTVDSAAVTGIGTPMATFAGNEVTVVLTGAVLDNKRLTIQLTGVNGTLDTSVSMGFLVGDVNNSRSTTSADTLQVKGRSGLATNISNFIYDINGNGSITSADTLQVKGRSGIGLNP